MSDSIKYLLEHPDKVTAIIAVLAFFVSGLSLFLTFRSISLQKKHNQLSVRPICWLALRDYENELRVEIQNSGTGPMIIQRLEVSKKGEDDVKGNVIDWLRTDAEWNTFISVFENRGLAAGSRLPILIYDGDHEDADFADKRDSVREELSQLNVRIFFTDIYNSKLKEFSRDLKWFQRNLMC